MFSLNALQQFFSDYLAVERPTLPLPFGGLVTIKTFATNEIQVRVASNIASLYRRDINKPRSGSAKREAGSLVLCAISQTDVETGEVMGTPRSRRFTSSARHMIREACAKMSQEYSLRVWFITLTLPVQHIAAIETFAQYDKEIKNAFLQNLRKLWSVMYPGKKFAGDYCIVSELQTSGAIHFHIALGWATERFAKVVKRLYRYWWWKLLQHYSRKTGTDLLTDADGYSYWNKPGEMLVECEQVEKSVESYMSKYLSKTVSKEQAHNVNTPSRWWSVSAGLRRKTLGERHGESFARETFNDALDQVESIAALATDAGPRS